MNEFIQKKCPTCGAILTIRNQAGIQNTTVTCPVCHNTYPFIQMKDVAVPGRVQTPPPHKTPDFNGAYPGYSSAPPASSGVPPRQGIPAQRPPRPYGQPSQGHYAMLLNQRTQERYPLLIGSNIIGRYSASSSANVKINTGGSLKMSREHLLIDVNTDAYGGLQFTASLCKPNCNETYINGNRLYFGNRMPIIPGMQISLPDASLILIVN